ncbi:hypothetical protein [Terasakiella sp. SH-1]|uniref:hypothetical protein n=1 Tax=Terasakiella sp. SH-1 TaxID=2560057 RepID=UPI0010746A43|nr:hypothetical protein [Terasakiella sp. SH-1]
MKKFAFVAVISAFALMGCKTAEQSFQEAGLKPLPTNEILKLIVGNTTNVVLAQGGIRATTYFRENGTMIAKNSRGGSSDGTWQTKGENQLCVNWAKWGRKCVKVYPSGNEYKEVDEGGKLYLTITGVRTGNPEGF